PLRQWNGGNVEAEGLRSAKPASGPRGYQSGRSGLTRAGRQRRVAKIVAKDLLVVIREHLVVDRYVAVVPEHDPEARIPSRTNSRRRNGELGRFVGQNPPLRRGLAVFPVTVLRKGSYVHVICARLAGRVARNENRKRHHGFRTGKQLRRTRRSDYPPLVDTVHPQRKVVHRFTEIGKCHAQNRGRSRLQLELIFFKRDSDSIHLDELANHGRFRNDRSNLLQFKPVGSYLEQITGLPYLCGVRYEARPAKACAVGRAEIS